MLKLSRKDGETLVLLTDHEEITIHFELIRDRIGVAIAAPESVRILRGELPECYPDDIER